MFLSSDIIDHVRDKFAQIICKNKAKVRKAAGTAVSKILHNLSAQDEVWSSEISGRTRTSAFTTQEGVIAKWQISHWRRSVQFFVIVTPFHEIINSSSNELT